MCVVVENGYGGGVSRRFQDQRPVVSKGVLRVVLLRRVIGDALRARRQSQHRTLREVSTRANVSLGYLSEIERGQKEASSELLAAICDALGAQLSEVLRDVSHTVADAERSAPRPASAEVTAPARPGADVVARIAKVPGTRAVATTVDGDVSVTVHQDTPLKATLRTTRTGRTGQRGRDVLSVA